MNIVALFTDFGWQGPYVGLLKLAIARIAPTLPVIDLLHDAPAFDVQCSAYLLATYAQEFPSGTVFVAVVDPGVGGQRIPLMLDADDRWFVGPDNGLFDQVAARAQQIEARRITWQPERLSTSFHGRDLFAPVVAMLAAGKASPEELGVAMPFKFQDWPDDLARIIYVDRYGNLITGIRAGSLEPEAVIPIAEQTLPKARTFSAVPVGQGFWYENSSGLVELAVNQGSAAERFGVRIGDTLSVELKGFQGNPEM
jgi:S-adenosylmethionine hydrolase